MSPSEGNTKISDLASEVAAAFAEAIDVTDVMIGCTAMLEAVNSLVFELGLWQSWTSIGKRKHAAADNETAG